MIASLATRLMTLRNDRRGVTAMEYGLIAALVAVGIAGAVGAMGTNMSGLFNSIATKLHVTMS